MGVMEEVEFVTSSECGKGSCVEAAAVQGGIVVRDSKDPSGPRLHFTVDEWNAFVAGVARGEYATERLQELASQASGR